MPSLTPVTTLFNGALGFGARVTDLVTFSSGGTTWLYAGCQPGVGLVQFDLGAGQAASYGTAAPFPAGADLNGPTRLDIFTHGSDTVILPSARFGAELGGTKIAANGDLGSAVTFSDGAGPDCDLTDLAVVRIGSTSWIYGSPAAGGGIAAWSLPDASSTLTVRTGVSDSAALYAGGPLTLLSGTAAGQHWLFSASATENGVTAFRVETSGALTAVASVGADQGFGIDAPAALDLVSVGGYDYLVVASEGSSSVSVFRVLAGALVPTDHVVDALSTRIDGVTAFDTVTVGGQAFVVAGGADDGLSLFRLLGDGRLYHVASYADTASLALTDVAAVEAVAVGGEIQVFVTSGSEDGLTQFTLNPGTVGVSLSGGAGSDSLTGGAADDILLGFAGDDTLSGGGGNDILGDGAGSDTLTGGAGQDVFVLTADATLDRITDFDTRYDRLDLSDWELLNSVAQLTITPTATGAILTYGWEVLEITSALYAPLTAADLSTASVLNLARTPVEMILDIRIASATAGDDRIVGFSFADDLAGLGGNDTLIGGAGADRLDGGAGSDTADYSLSGAAVDITLGGAVSGGDAEGDILISVENITGSAFDDLIDGDAGANTLIGGAGDDRLTGWDGDDVLDGGVGHDVLTGGDGVDWLYGQTDDDTLDGGAGGDALFGGDGADQIAGGAGDDGLNGGSGADSLDGGPGVDWLFGGDGDDLMLGGDDVDALFGEAGADHLDGGAGGDSLDGGYDDDVLEGGAGVDWLFGGFGNDTLYGASAAVDSADTDALFGQEGDDTLWGGGGGDSLDGGSGADAIHGGDGDDWLYGQDDDDTLWGDGGSDVLFGGAGNDTLHGGATGDSLDGGDGNDTLSGGAGTDILFGGAGQTISCSFCPPTARI